MARHDPGDGGYGILVRVQLDELAGLRLFARHVAGHRFDFRAEVGHGASRVQGKCSGQRLRTGGVSSAAWTQSHAPPGPSYRGESLLRTAGAPGPGRSCRRQALDPADVGGGIVGQAAGDFLALLVAQRHHVAFAKVALGRHDADRQQAAALLGDGPTAPASSTSGRAAGRRSRSSVSTG